MFGVSGQAMNSEMNRTL